MPQTLKSNPKGSTRAGFTPDCRLRRIIIEGLPAWRATWKGKPALRRDGSLRNFTSPDYARAWLAAMDVTNGRIEPV